MYSNLAFLDHPGEMAQRIRDFDWSSNPLGPPDSWPQALRFAVNLCLGSGHPTAIYWGPELRLLYNDAWSAVPAERHPGALAARGQDVFAEVWDIVGPQLAQVIETARGFVAYDQRLDIPRDGQRRETYWNYSFAPLRDEYGRVVGVFNEGHETTRTVLQDRQRRHEYERLRYLFDQAPAAIALLDGRDHVYRIANSRHRALIGQRELLGRPLAEAVPELAEQGMIERLDQVRRTGNAFVATAMPHRLQDADGAERLIHADVIYQPVRRADGRTTAIFVQMTDVTERVAAETARRQSEERLQLALGASDGVGTWDWNIATDMVTADARFARIYGVDPDIAARGAPLAEFFRRMHPDDAGRVGDEIAAAIETRGKFASEYRLLQADGSVRWVVAQGRLVAGQNGEADRLPGVTFDITTRREAEEQALSIAAELRHANETQSFLYALADRQRGLDTPQAILRHTVGALGRRMGLDRVGFYRVATDDVMVFGPCWTNGDLPVLRGTMTPADLGAEAHARYRAGRTLAVNDTAADATYRDTAIARHSVATVGVPLIRGGRWVGSLYANQASARTWSDEEIAFLEAVAEITWDAVERVEAVAALRESEAKFRAIANSIDPMVWSTLPDGYHDYYNDRWYEFTGVPYGSTDGEAWNDMFHPDDRDRAWAQWRHCLATGEQYHIEYRLRHRSGAYRWVLGRAQPVRDDADRITRWFGTCTDIQDIVEAREVLARSRAELETAIEERTRQLLATEDQLRQAQKMEAVGQLTGGIAHDFNNMLAVVIGALDLLDRRLKQGSTDVDRYVVAARDGASRAAALTQRLLAFARQTPLAPAPVDVNALVRGMIDLVNRTIGDDIRVETRLDDAVSAAVTDASQLENVILNLSVNARDAMPRGGTLTIATRPVALDAAAAAAMGLGAGDYVAITVADTGAGMAPDIAARAFEPFFTTKGVGKGTGLGLSQVFGFVRQSGGHVALDSTPGAGTQVRLFLPAHHRPAAAASAARTPAPDLPRGDPSQLILVVEDEDRVRNFSVEALRELGYTVTHASDGPDALAQLDRGLVPTLLFTDVVMPEMTGPELAARAQRLLPGLRVLYTSGYTRDIVDEGALGEGGLLRKPFDLEQLARRVRASIDA